MKIEAVSSHLGVLDRVAAQDSFVHRLDARAKVLATAAFLVTAMSFPRFELAELMPLALYPILFLAIGQIPLGVLGRGLLLALPFVLALGLINPWFDRRVVAHWGSLAITSGWLSFASILLRFLLTVSAALLLLACTGYVGISAALGRLGAPAILVTQFLLLYRFLFILADEMARMQRAHALRAPQRHRPTLRVWASLAGHLLLRTYDRGLRLHAAMLARGFDGVWRPLRTPRWTWTDSAFLAACLGYFLAVRYGHLAQRLGTLTLETFA